MVLDLKINGITQTERWIRSQNNDGPRFRRDTGAAESQPIRNLAGENLVTSMIARADTPRTKDGGGAQC